MTGAFLFRADNTPYYGNKRKGEIYMKKVFNIAMILFVGFAIGVNFECSCMANDEEYRDYWIKRFKKDSE